VEALDAGLKVTVDKSQIVLSDPLKETGTFDIAVKLHPDLTCTVKVWVVEE
jgi:ribosomal protein L9